MTVACDLSTASADAVTVDALCQLQLAARRRGWTLRLEQVSPELYALICYAGLDQVLSCELAIKPGRQAK